MLQFIVFAAFAIVLGVPQEGPPWMPGMIARFGWLGSPEWMWMLVVGQPLLAAGVGAWCSRAVVVRLEREPAWLPSAQQKLMQGAHVSRMCILGAFLLSVLQSNWVLTVNGWPGVQRVWGLDECLVLSPFFLAILVSWVVLYPADQAIRQVSLEHRLVAGHPARPVWRLGAYIMFMFRQHVLIIAAPMLPIIVANDFALAYRREINEAVGLKWADQGVLVIMAGIVFLFVPLVLRCIWETRVLPNGELRSRLEELCERVDLRYREILVWETDGMVVNAAVMGLLKPFRFVLLSDGLLEMMDDRRIEAVFGHEAGHVKHRHIEFFLLFAILSMLIVGGINLLISLCVHRYAPDLFATQAQMSDYLQFSGMVLIVLFWGVGFGVVSRRFEWQADLFGARSVTPGATECSVPCVVHGTATVPTTTRGRCSPVCSTAADLFADALGRIAALNGIPPKAPSWRHSSIANRVELLRKYAVDPTLSAKLELSVLLIKAILFLGTIVGLAIGVWIFLE